MTGTNTGIGDTVLTVTFNKPSTGTPIVVITAADEAARKCTWWATANGFTLNYLGAFASPSFNYIVID